MKTSLFVVILSAAGFLVSCERPSASPPLPNPPPPTTAAVPAIQGERERLEAEIDRLRAEEHAAASRLLQQQQAALQVERAELEEERAELDRKRLELTAAAAEAPAPQASSVAEKAQPVAPVPAAAEVPPPRATSAAETRDYHMFFEALAPHGRWLESEEYGWVWQPAAAGEVEWRPYTRGRWMDSDQGWAWMSDEPFGWATYHYGRWALLVDHGWIWVPGDIWAPAWVVWRRNEECVGWAPLPPETLYAEETTIGSEVEADYGLNADWYTFLPVRHFDEPVVPYCRPVAENHHFFGLTVSITNIVIRRERVECRGPEPRWVNSCLTRPMRRHTIHHRHDWRGGDDFRARFDDDRLSCYAPRVRASWNDGIGPRRRDGRLEKVRVVRHEESFREEVARRYHDQRRDRCERADAALRREPVRQLVERHADLERIRAARVIAEGKRGDRPGRDSILAERARDGQLLQESQRQAATEQAQVAEAKERAERSRQAQERQESQRREAGAHAATAERQRDEQATREREQRQKEDESRRQAAA
ncbi:MAG: DUF6600 domain-containing protein, partial [Verrucomicrobiales bacterium]